MIYHFRVVALYQNYDQLSFVNYPRLICNISYLFHVFRKK